MTTQGEKDFRQHVKTSFTKIIEQLEIQNSLLHALYQNMRERNALTPPPAVPISLGSSQIAKTLEEQKAKLK